MVKIPWELTSGPHLSGGPGRLLSQYLKGEALGASQGRSLEKGVPNSWKTQTVPGSLALWRNTKALSGGGMEWGREYEGVREVKGAVRPDTDGRFRFC